MTILELKENCEKLIKEFSSDASVILEFRNEDGSLIKAQGCISSYRDAEGNLYLSNKEFKRGSWE